MENARQRVVIHRGPIPGTNVGHHWFASADGNRYGICSSPHGVNRGWGYVIDDADGRTVDDSMFRFDQIREWAAVTWADV
jgi:hypothetical protein